MHIDEILATGGIVDTIVDLEASLYYRFFKTGVLKIV